MKMEVDIEIGAVVVQERPLVDLWFCSSCCFCRDNPGSGGAWTITDCCNNTLATVINDKET